MTDLLRIENGDAVGVGFKRDDVRYDQHETYGKSWCYLVTCNGPNGVETRSLRAYEGLQRALLKANVSKGMRAVISRRQGEGNAVIWDIEVHASGDGKSVTVKDWDGNILSPNLLSPDYEEDTNGNSATPPMPPRHPCRNAAGNERPDVATHGAFNAVGGGYGVQSLG